MDLMTSKELRSKFLEFFALKGHKIIPSASLIPEGDPTVLFTTAGMHPLVPYLLGEKHPLGKRLCNIQKCLRTDDIEEVGDSTHLTFFEMLGYWSLGDYWKEESIVFSFEFLTKILGLEKERIYVTVFEGEGKIPQDQESIEIWQKRIGLPKERIFFLPRSDNFWGPVGQIGPCGPCTEMFYDTGLPPCGPNCRPGCHCGKYLEVGNNVFMEYFKDEKGEFQTLKQKNVDVGLGLERDLAAANGKNNVFETDLFEKIIQTIRSKAQDKENPHSERIIADHLRAATFILADGVKPANVEQGYILRRLIRRAIRHGKVIGLYGSFCAEIAQKVIEDYQGFYPELAENQEIILVELEKEEERFSKTLQQGLKEFEKVLAQTKEGIILGEKAFYLYETYGFPLEMTIELAGERGKRVDVEGFNKALRQHQELSRKGSEAKFKGGLSDHSLKTTKLHTATHLLHQALRQVLGSHVRQAGSNITAERLRFDFTHPQKLTPQEIKEIEKLVNQKIQEGLPVKVEEMTPQEAKIKGAIGLFERKYGEKVKVYSIGDFSKEICAGPHVKNTQELGHFKIIKEEASSAGVRRIKAILVDEKSL